MSSLHDTLLQCGFNSSDIEIYTLLASEGELDISSTITLSSVSRATVYDSLENLEKAELVQRRKEGRNVYYQITHPENLHKLADEQKRAAEIISHDMEKHVEHVTSLYREAVGKPGVRIFEGFDEVQEMLYDSLDDTKEILTFLNSDIFNTKDPKVRKKNEEYVAARLHKKIPKKIIMVGTPFAKQRGKALKNDLTDIKFIDRKKYPFDLSVQVYKEKVATISVHKKNIIGFLVNHPGIAQFHRSLFQQTWDTLD